MREAIKMDKKYLVAVKIDEEKENLIFEFPTREERDSFIKDIKEKGADYATSEVGEE